MTKAKTKRRRVWLVLTYRRDDIRSVHMTREQARTRGQMGRFAMRLYPIQPITWTPPAKAKKRGGRSDERADHADQAQRSLTCE